MTITTTPANAAADINVMIDLNLPVLMLGQPGVGKSDVARQVAAKRGVPIIDFRATLIDPVDLHGLPVANKEKGVAEWLPMGLLPNEERDGAEGILFIDEITNADNSVKGALYGLVLDRFIGEYRLPAGWRIIAAGNRVEDRAAAGRLGSALGNRFVQINVEPTVDDWIAHAISVKAPAELISFIRFRPELLNDFDGARPINATPRSWMMAAKIVQQKLPAEQEARLIMGAVGEAAGTEFAAFLRVFRELPNPDQVLMDPDGAKVPDNSAAQYAISGALAKRVTENSFDAFVTYMKRLPAEFGVLAMRDATARDAELTMTGGYQQWVLENQDIYL